MKLPRDLSGSELARVLRRYGYEIVWRESSHLRLTSNYKAIPTTSPFPTIPN